MREWDITCDEIYEPLYYTEQMKQELAEEYAKLMAEDSEWTA